MSSARKLRLRASVVLPDLGLQNLEGFEQVQHRAVAHRQRRGLGGLPARAELAAFEEREAVGVEEAAAVGRELEPVVLDTAVDGPERGQQPSPGVVAQAKDFLAELVGRDTQLLPQRADGVVLVVEFVAQEQQFPLLGAEQEHQPHHDGEGRLVENLFVHVGQQLPPVVLVGLVERLDQDLDRLADLIAKLVGDFLLVAGALVEQGFERLGRPAR